MPGNGPEYSRILGTARRLLFIMFPFAGAHVVDNIEQRDSRHGRLRDRKKFSKEEISEIAKSTTAGNSGPRHKSSIDGVTTI